MPCCTRPGRWRAALAVLACLAATCDGDDGSPTIDPNAPRVVDISPAAEALTAAVDVEIVIRLDRAIEPSTVADEDVRIVGRWSGVHRGRVQLTAGGIQLRATLDRPLAHGEAVMVTLPAGAVEAAGSRTPAIGFGWTFRTGAAAATFDIARVGTVAVRRPGEGRVQTYGAYAGDLDGDGWSDLVVPNEQSNDLRVFLNDGAGGYGGFGIVAVPRGAEPSTNEGADFDGDGDLDFAVGTGAGRWVAVYFGDGAGGLVHGQDLDAGNEVRGLCLLDFENDGDVDIAATAAGAGHVALFENDGRGRFTRTRTIDAGTGEWSCATGDANGDGRIDLFIGARASLQLVTLGSNGDGTFTELDRTAAGGDPWMLVAGDMNGDGHVDVVAVNPQVDYVAVLTGDGAGRMRLLDRYNVPGFPLAVDIGDLDGDGDLDVVTSSFASAAFTVFANDGAGALARVPLDLRAPASASCTVLHDRDGDGDLDITGVDEIDDALILFANR